MLNDYGQFTTIEEVRIKSVKIKIKQMSMETYLTSLHSTLEERATV